MHTHNDCNFKIVISLLLNNFLTLTSSWTSGVITLSCKKHQTTVDNLRVVVAAQNLSIVCIVETWLSEDISVLEISIENYALVRLERWWCSHVRSHLTWEILLRGYLLVFINIVFQFCTAPHQHQFLFLIISVLYNSICHLIKFWSMLQSLQKQG